MILIDAVNTIREFLETHGEFKSTAEWVSYDGTALRTDWGYFEQGLDELLKISESGEEERGESDDYTRSDSRIAKFAQCR